MIDTASGKELFHTEGGDLIVTSPDERILAVSDPVSGERFRRDRRVGHNRPPAGFFLTSAESGTIRLLDAGTGKEIQRMAVDGSKVWAMWSMATATTPGRTRMAVDGSKVWAMAFAPDGKTLAATTGWDSGRIHFFDVPSGKETRKIDSPPLRSPALAFTPDGTRLVSGMADGSVLVWDVRAAR